MTDVPSRTLGSSIPELPELSTNGAAQWGLAAIENLTLIGNSAPAMP